MTLENDLAKFDPKTETTTVKIMHGKGCCSSQAYQIIKNNSIV